MKTTATRIGTAMAGALLTLALVGCSGTPLVEPGDTTPQRNAGASSIRTASTETPTPAYTTNLAPIVEDVGGRTLAVGPSGIDAPMSEWWCVRDHLRTMVDESPARKLIRWTRSPKLRIYNADRETNEDIYWRVVESVRELNTALPRDVQITQYRGWQIDRASIGEFVSGDLGDLSAVADTGSIAVFVLKPETVKEACNGSPACASYRTDGHGAITAAVVAVPEDALEESHAHWAEMTIMHELLHAVGFTADLYDDRYKDQSKYWGSLMARDIDSADYGKDQNVATLPPFDRDTLHALYVTQERGAARGDIAQYREWGEWGVRMSPLAHRWRATSGGIVEYGVTYRHDRVHAWARGPAPHYNSLAWAVNSENPNRYLREYETATWSGDFVGASQGPRAGAMVEGASALQIRLSGVVDPDSKRDGTLRLTKLEMEGVRWKSGTLRYGIDVWGNKFTQNGEEGDEGHVDGVFLGRWHESAAGTVRRVDLVGAFSGERGHPRQ